ncbi:hypothetical protein Taro_005558 [Colocasia esculenta]|uniref:Uncharacterized protein n=1 Tax=Colocasia esculenta TaxID=4460 RepID=A0A843TTF1_COLES|nr:hypothetical protein [Colocasia esculenta]
MLIRHCHPRCLELYCSNAPTGKLNVLCDTLGKGLDKVYTLAKGLVKSWRWTSSTGNGGKSFPRFLQELRLITMLVIKKLAAEELARFEVELDQGIEEL